MTKKAFSNECELTAISKDNKDNNNNNTKGKKKEQPKEGIEEEAEDILDARIRQLRQETLQAIQSQQGSGHDQLAALRKLIEIDTGQTAESLAAGWRRAHRGFQLF
jgi:hypothetical protein